MIRRQMGRYRKCGSGRTIPWKHSEPRAGDDKCLAEVLAQFKRTYDEIRNDARGAIDEPVSEQWHFPVALFPDDDVVWIGRDVRDSGKESYRWRFRRAIDWLREDTCPGAFICPSAFQPGVFSRSDTNVAVRRFLVVESDELNRDEIGAVFTFVEHAFEMRLRAVIDTAGRSLHGWFDFPSEDVMKQLRDILPRLKCDPAMFAPSQPSRLPGAQRGEAFQRLIYFDY
jgi:hypothetical protein